MIVVERMVFRRTRILPNARYISAFRNAVAELYAYCRILCRLRIFMPIAKFFTRHLENNTITQQTTHTHTQYSIQL